MILSEFDFQTIAVRGHIVFFIINFSATQAEIKGIRKKQIINQ